MGLACALLHGPAGLAAAVALLGLCIGFLFALCRALRVGAGCSCFGRLSRTSVGGRELGRAVALLAIGGTVVVLRALPPNGRPGLGLSISAAVGAGFLALAMVVGERLRPAAGHPANIRPRDLLGFDSGLYSTTAARLRGVPIRPAPRLTADALRAAVDVVRTAPHTSVLLARERVDGCGDARWNAANAALNPATGLISLSVPTAGGCLLVARLRDGRPRELVTVTVLAANRGYVAVRHAGLGSHRR